MTCCSRFVPLPGLGDVFSPGTGLGWKWKVMFLWSRFPVCIVLFIFFPPPELLPLSTSRHSCASQRRRAASFQRIFLQMKVRGCLILHRTQYKQNNIYSKSCASQGGEPETCKLVTWACGERGRHTPNVSMPLRETGWRRRRSGLQPGEERRWWRVEVSGFTLPVSRAQQRDLEEVYAAPHVPSVLILIIHLAFLLSLHSITSTFLSCLGSM